MSTPETEATTTSTEATDPAPKPEAPKPEAPAQAETDWKVEARKWEERAKENNKAAARLAEIEDANKTESQRLTDAKAALEKERDEARGEVLRLRVATKFGIADDDVDLFLTGSDEETLTKQAQRLAARDEAAGKPRSPKPDANQGRSNHSPATTADQFAAALGDRLNR